jgi:ribonuclease P protein component
MHRRLRLTASSDFRRVYGARRGVGGAHLVVHSRPNSLGHPRVGFSVSAKVGGAVIRNLVKRRLRAAAGDLLGTSERSMDFVVVARPSCATAAYAELLAELDQLIARAGS